MALRRCALLSLLVLVARAQDDGDEEDPKEKSKRDIVAVHSDRRSRPMQCPW